MRRCLNCNREQEATAFTYDRRQNNRICWSCRLNYVRERRKAIAAGVWTPTFQKRSFPQEATTRAVRSPSTSDLAWAAGFLEAEGSFAFGASLTVSANQKEREPLELLLAMFGGGICGRTTGEQALYQWAVYGPRAHGVMLTLYSMLSGRRQNQIRTALRFPLLPAWSPPPTVTPTGDPDRPRCTRCGHEKPLAEFPLNRGRRISECRACKNAYLKRRYEEKKAGTWNPGKQGACLSKEATPRATLSPTVTDLYWAAGFLEGEGSFRHTVGNTDEVSAPQVNPEPLFRLQALLGGSVIYQDREQSPLWVWRASGARARGIMMTLYLLMSARRQDQIRAALGR